MQTYIQTQGEDTYMEGHIHRETHTWREIHTRGTYNTEGTCPISQVLPAPDIR